jgi:hypothetical protein
MLEYDSYSPEARIFGAYRVAVSGLGGFSPVSSRGPKRRFMDVSHSASLVGVETGLEG